MNTVETLPQEDLYHVHLGNQNPTLILLPKPTGGFEWNQLPEDNMHGHELLDIDEQE